MSGCLHLDIVQVHHRIQRDDAGVGGLAHDLAVHLAAGGHVDHQVAFDTGVSRTAGVPEASGLRRAYCCSAAVNAVTLAARELTPCLGNSPSMTRTWQRPHSRPSAAHRINIDAESTSRLEEGRSDGKSPALS